MGRNLDISYANLAVQDEGLLAAYDEAIGRVRRDWLGTEVPLFVKGERVTATEQFASRSPIDTDVLVCQGQKGTKEEARAAIAAAGVAFPRWRTVPWEQRVAAVRSIADRMSEQVLEMAALMVWEVGKSRGEALAEVAETIGLLRYYADAMERNDGYSHPLGKLNPDDPNEQNASVLRPYGVWVVLSPFNFPLALAAAPIAAALVTGNTVVFKGSSDTPYVGWKTAEMFAEEGLLAGVFNYVSGPGSVVGQELQDSAAVDGWTFTGSYEIGMQVLHAAANGPVPRPAIIEMGGKNPAVVSESADLDQAALGVMRSAFGLSGQKCSACSRVYVHGGVYETFREKLVELTRAVVVGDPTARDTFMGAVINRKAYQDYQRYIDMARRDGRVLVGGHVLAEGALSRGYFVEPAIVEGLPEDHELVKTELFLPILHLARVDTLDEAMAKANDTIYGLTAGFYGEDPDEIACFFERIEAGTTYANRPGGATTGAWPGVQAFGGWKGSGVSGKGIGGLYTLPLYMHEQSRTLIGTARGRAGEEGGVDLRRVGPPECY
jgi:1-pyrroline-5-carboxylate dehydrogenase